MQAVRKHKRPGNPRYWTDPIMIFVLALVLGGFGGFAYWSATAPLAQGITANGILGVKDQRRTIQHLEGGIISSIAIREGGAIAAGDTLIELSDSNANARLNQVDADISARAARMDRLESALQGRDAILFQRFAKLANGNTNAEPIMRGERQVFADQNAALNGQRNLVNAKLERLAAEAAALLTRIDGKQNELATLQDELEVQSQALQQQMGNISRLNDVKRSVAVIEAEIAALEGQKLVNASSVKEAEQELLQVELTHRADSARELTLLRAELAPLNAERVALLDRRQRRKIVAPVDGVVIDLKYTAVGGVIPPGEAIFDIVPSDEVWRVDVRFSPQDRDNLSQGRRVNLRFGSLDPINPPEISGTIDVIAADATFESRSQEFYYAAEVSIPADQLITLDGFELSPGIPVEVFMESGVTRTPFSYFVEPFEVMLRLGLRG